MSARLVGSVTSDITSRGTSDHGIVAVDVGLLRQAEHALTEDVALHLGRPAGDGLRADAQERPRRVLQPPIALGPRLRRRSLQVDGQVLQPLRVLAEEQLRDRAFGPGRLSGPSPVGGPLVGERHEPVLDVGLRQALPEHRIGHRCVPLDERDRPTARPTVPGSAAPLPETACRSFMSIEMRDAPPLVDRAEPQRVVDLRVVEEHLAELGVAGDLTQRADGDARLLHRHEERGDPSVLGRVGVGAGEQQAERRDVAEAGPHLLPADGPSESPSRTALVARPARSEPAPGSENSWHQISSLRAIGRRKRSFCSSVPQLHDRRPDEIDADGVVEARHLVAAERAPDGATDARRQPQAAVLRRPRRGDVAGAGELRPQLVGVDLGARLDERVGIVTVDRRDPVVGQVVAEEALDLGGDGVDVAVAALRSLPPGLPLLGERFRPLEAVGVVAVGEEQLPAVLHRLRHRPVERRSDRPLRRLDGRGRTRRHQLGELDGAVEQPLRLDDLVDERRSAAPPRR